MAHRRLPPLPLLAFCAAILATTAPAQTVLPGNHSIDGNLCAGPDCSNSETFPGSADLKLKSFDTRILFEDNSTASGAPTVDWELRANDSGSGFDYFAIRNADTGTQIFRLDDGAPTNSFYVNDDGDIGLGTSIPEADLHIESGVIADIRLSRNASGGSPAQSFDIEVESAGLAFGDNVTGHFPFIIRPNAPNLAIAIEGNRLGMNDFGLDYDIVMASVSNTNAFHLDAAQDRIGMGTNTPDAPLHILRNSTTSPGTAPAGILVEDTGTETPRGLMTLRNNGNVFFALENTAIAAGDNTGRQWNFQNNGGEFRVTTAPGGGSDIEMRLTTGGDMIIEGNYFASSGTQLNVPDYVFAPEYNLKPLSEVQAFIDTHSHLPGVPSAAEINAQGLNMTDMQMRLLKKVEELTLYTLEQEAELAELRSLKARMAALEQALADK